MVRPLVQPRANDGGIHVGLMTQPLIRRFIDVCISLSVIYGHITSSVL
jgi:hypothetical protein